MSDISKELTDPELTNGTQNDLSAVAEKSGDGTVLAGLRDSISGPVDPGNGGHGGAARA